MPLGFIPSVTHFLANAFSPLNVVYLAFAGGGIALFATAADMVESGLPAGATLTPITAAGLLMAAVAWLAKKLSTQAEDTKKALEKSNEEHKAELKRHSEEHRAELARETKTHLDALAIIKEEQSCERARHNNEIKRLTETYDKILLHFLKIDESEKKLLTIPLANASTDENRH